MLETKVPAAVILSLAVVILVPLACLILLCVKRLTAAVSALQRDHAQFETLAKAALQKHKSETCMALDQSDTHLKMFAKSARHWQTRFKHHGKNNSRTLKKLNRRLVKQGQQVRSLKAKQAQHIARLECCVCTVGLEMDQKVLQLATDVKEGHVQHSQLSSEVRANTKAQDLLMRLAGVVDALRTQLQVSVGAHETVKQVANDMTQVKQDLANIQGTRLHMRQQTGMLAELRYELKTNADSREDLQTRTASLEKGHALMTHSLRSQHQGAQHAPVKSPKRSSSRLAAVQEVYYEMSNGEEAYLPFDAVHTLRGPILPHPSPQLQPQGLSLSANSYSAAVHGNNHGQHSSTQEPVWQKRLSDFQDVQAANYRSRSLQQLQQAYCPVQPAERRLRKFASLPMKGSANAAPVVAEGKHDDSVLPHLWPLEGQDKPHSSGGVHNEGQTTTAPLQTYIAAMHGNVGTTRPKATPFELTTQEAKNEAYAPVPSGPRVIDQVGASRVDQDKQGYVKQPSLRMAAMQGSMQQQGLNTSAVTYRGSAVKLPLYQAPGSGPSAPPDTPTKMLSTHRHEVVKQQTALSPFNSKVSDSPFATHKGIGPGPHSPATTYKADQTFSNNPPATREANGSLPTSPVGTRKGSKPVSDSLFVTHQGEGTADSPLIGWHSLPTQASDPSEPSPFMPPPQAQNQPAQVMPASPKETAHDHLTSGLSSEHAAQESAKPQSSLLTQMGMSGRKPFKALVKSLRKDL